MQDVLTRIASMQRPRLLGRAARIGAQDYRRDLHLPRLLKVHTLPRSAEALLKLSEMETELNEKRITGETSYHLPRHVEVLIAIVAEAALLRKSSQRFEVV
ncbi:MAG: DUF6477 family protein [Aliishimia sp.]